MNNNIDLSNNSNNNNSNNSNNNSNNSNNNNNNNKNLNKTKLWINDPHVFLDKASLFELWPMEHMDREQKINAISRLVIYLTFLGVFLLRSVKILITGIVTLGILVVLYYFLNNKANKLLNNKLKEGFSDEAIYEKLKQNFTNPNTANPLMNLMLPEIYDNPNRLTAAPLYNKAVERKMNDSVKNIVKKNFDDENIDEKLFKREENKFNGDDFQFEQSMRQFYTTPNTLVPNNQKDFARFCYGNMASCKDGDVEMCLKATRNHVNI